MSIFVDIANLITDLTQSIKDFFYTDIYSFFTEFISYFFEWAIVNYFKFKLFMLVFLWDIADNILLHIQLGAYLNNVWYSLESRTLSLLTFMRIPEAINIIISAAATKFLMRFIGF